MKLKLDKILKNKIVLYLTFFLALVTIFGYLVKQNYQAILFFTLVLFLTKYFSNNMIVILGVSIIATNFLDLFRLFSGSHLEGMENAELKKKAFEKGIGETLSKHYTNVIIKDAMGTAVNEHLLKKYPHESNKKTIKMINKLKIDIDKKTNAIKGLPKNQIKMIIYQLKWIKTDYENLPAKHPKVAKKVEKDLDIKQFVELIESIIEDIEGAIPNEDNLNESFKKKEKQPSEKQPSEKVQKVLQHIASKYFGDEFIWEELASKNVTSLREGAQSLKNMKISKDKLSSDINTYKTKAHKLTLSDITYLTDLANFWKAFYQLQLDGTDNTENSEIYSISIDAINKGIELLNHALNEKLKKDDKTEKETTTKLDSEFGSVACANDEKYDKKTKKCISKNSTSKKEAMSTLHPANLGEVNNSGSGNLNNFNDAKMKELAFDNLDKIFGNDNMRSLPNEANSLNEKQNAIMAQLKDMGPLLSQAMNLIKNVDINAINNVSSKMNGMINNLQDLKSN